MASSSSSAKSLSNVDAMLSTLLARKSQQQQQQGMMALSSSSSNALIREEEGGDDHAAAADDDGVDRGNLDDGVDRGNLRLARRKKSRRGNNGVTRVRIEVQDNDFRRPQIRENYALLKKSVDENQQFYILKFRCICSSGTYMRSLASMIGEGLGSTGVAFSIHRTKMGKYKKFGPISFWGKQY